MNSRSPEEMNNEGYYLPAAQPTILSSQTETDLVSKPSTESEIKIYNYINKINIAEELDEEKLTEIANYVVTGFEEDKRSSAEWMEQVETAQKLAKLTKEPKNYPLPNSANIKYPLITTACQQFAARTYPEVVKNGRVVKAAVVGRPTQEKIDLGERISKHMSYQLLYQSQEWERSLDNLLIMLANVGLVFKKTFYDPLKNRIRSILCKYDEIYVNSEIHELADARRITHRLTGVTLNDLIEGARAGVYLSSAVEELKEHSPKSEIDNSFELLEQHRYLDLDEDGYEEPYVVTICTKNRKVLRIIARYTEADIALNINNEVMRINPIQYFTDFHFLPSPCGKFHSLGFGTLMLHLNETINTILNQLIDAGRLANLRGGYIDARLKLPNGQTLHDPGEWKKVKAVGLINIKDGMFPMDYREPSNVLLQLLGTLIETGKSLSSSTEVLRGQQDASRAPASTVSALIDQGLKEFLAIQRRFYRGLKDEFQKVFNLNKIYLDPYEYITILDDEFAVAQRDYDNKSIDILPIADPNLSSDVQRMVQDQALLMILNEPEIDRYEVLRRHLDTLQVPDKEKILPPPQPQPPNPDIIAIQADIEHKAQLLNLKDRELKLKESEFEADLLKTKFEIIKLYNESLKISAEAEAIEPGQQLEMYKSHLDSLKFKFDSMLKQNQFDKDVMQQILDQKNMEASNVQPPTDSTGMA